MTNRTARAPLIYSLTIGAALIAGALGSLFTTPSIAGWYAHLVQPSWTPPSWVFAPVWTTLYILMGIAAGLVWQRGSGKPERAALALYWAQLVLNAAWSIVFFGLHSIVGGLVIIVLLLVAIIALILRAAPISRAAGWLLVPYILWVLYATSLNVGILILN